MKVRSSVLLLFSVACSAQTFQGRVINGTTSNPQPSCQVILFTSSGEQGRALTNDSGEFRIVPHSKLDRRSAAILQVTQNGVDYFQPAIQGQFTNVKVFQSAKAVDPISSPLTILQFQSAGKRLQVTELHALNNISNPPITQVDPDNFVLSIPHGAQIEPAMIAAPDGGTTKVPLVLVAPSPVAGATVAKSVDRYRIDFPIEPGLTKYAIRYEIPYDAQEFVFRRQTQYPMDRIGVMVPPSIRFRSLGANLFHPVADQSGTQQQEIDGLAANVPITFTLSGTGTLAHSFHPLNPGERAMPRDPNPHTSTPLLRSELPAASVPLPPVHAGLAGQERMIAIGALLLAGILFWCFRLRRNADGVRK